MTSKEVSRTSVTQAVSASGRGKATSVDKASVEVTTSPRPGVKVSFERTRTIERGGK